jgi:hypothetical protein
VAPHSTSRFQAFSAYQRNAGLHRAAYWRRLGFINLVLARKARWKGHVRKGERAGEIELDTPFRLPKRRRGF